MRVLNPGLQRRFPWIHKVGKYSEQDLVNIFIKLLEERGWECTVPIGKCVKLVKDNYELFRNFGGDIDNYITKCQMAHAQRIISSEVQNRYVLIKEDLYLGIEMMKRHQLFEPEKESTPPWSMYM